MGRGDYRRKMTINGRGIIEGVAEGLALVIKEKIQGWSGIDHKTGKIIEKRHTFEGYSLKSSVLIVTGGKGSTGWATHFHVLRIMKNGPNAMIIPKIDSRTAAAAVLLKVPCVTDIKEDLFSIIKTGDMVKVDGTNGIIEIFPKNN